MLNVGDTFKASLAVTRVDPEDGTMLIEVKGATNCADFWATDEEVLSIDPTWEERTLLLRIKKDSDRLHDL